MYYSLNRTSHVDITDMVVNISRMEFIKDFALRFFDL